MQNIHISPTNHAEIRQILGTEPPKVIQEPVKTEPTTGSKLLKTLAGMGIIALGSLMALQPKKADYISEAQQTFQEAFLRDNISREETLEILKRYKEIKKIPDKEEYIKAMFQEAKKNFGFENANIDLFLTEPRIHGKYETLGNTNNLCGYIEITKTQSREKAADSIHHEFRHMLQAYYGYNLNPEKFVEGTLYGQLKSKGKDNEFIDRVITPSYVKDNVKDIQQYMNIEHTGIENIPEQHLDFARNILASTRNYICSDSDHNGYMNTFEERDAYRIGRMMGKLINTLPEDLF